MFLFSNVNMQFESLLFLLEFYVYGYISNIINQKYRKGQEQIQTIMYLNPINPEKVSCCNIAKTETLIGSKFLDMVHVRV